MAKGPAPGWPLDPARPLLFNTHRSAGRTLHLGTDYVGQALEISLAQWSAWGVLALVIIWIDRHLPLERDALVRRFLFHVPLSVIFTVAYTYLNHAILTLLDAPRDASLLAGGVLGTAWRVIHRNSTFFYWVIVGTYIAVDYQNHLKNRLVRTAELEKAPLGCALERPAERNCSRTSSSTR